MSGRHLVASPGTAPPFLPQGLSKSPEGAPQSPPAPQITSYLKLRLSVYIEVHVSLVLHLKRNKSIIVASCFYRVVQHSTFGWNEITRDSRPCLPRLGFKWSACGWGIRIFPACSARTPLSQVSRALSMAVLVPELLPLQKC